MYSASSLPAQSEVPCRDERPPISVMVSGTMILSF
jgi:hypothetical protein